VEFLGWSLITNFGAIENLQVSLKSHGDFVSAIRDYRETENLQVSLKGPGNFVFAPVKKFIFK